MSASWTKSSEIPQGTLRVRTKKFRGEVEAAPATVPLDGVRYPKWSGSKKARSGKQMRLLVAKVSIHSKVLSVRDECGNAATDEIRKSAEQLHSRDAIAFNAIKDNRFEAWPGA